MSQFIQLHLLTSYAPANLNRDDLGRPKTAKMGGFERLRVSSQSLKRSWRVSELFESAVGGHNGIRTRLIGKEAFKKFIEGGISEKDAKEWASSIANIFRKDQKKDVPEMKEIVFLSYAEKQRIDDVVSSCIASKTAPSSEALLLLDNTTQSVDVGLFGRMLTGNNSDKGIDGVCQVAHAISVHSVVVEDDYFSAVDDLNESMDEFGAGHISESGFAAALFYSYICINKTQLIENLNGNEELANAAIRALTEAAVKVSPTGKQNSFASRAYASFALAEKGQQQPRQLSVAFLKPINDADQAAASIAALTKQVTNFDKVYGECADARCQFNAITGEGSLAELLNFVAE